MSPEDGSRDDEGGPEGTARQDGGGRQEGAGPDGRNAPTDRVGLCRTCQHHRVVANRRGSRFYMCERSLEDETFPKYPPLPVLECRGYEGGGEDPWEQEFGRKEDS